MTEGGLHIRGHLRKGSENTNANFSSFCYFVCAFHSDLHQLTAGKGREVNLNARLRHTNTLFFHLFLASFSHANATKKYAAHSQDASACGQLHHRPRAAGSEVIMRARSICSLTPAVCLDYRNINRPGLTGSPLKASQCLSEHRNSQQSARLTEKHGLMLTFALEISLGISKLDFHYAI